MLTIVWEKPLVLWSQTFGPFNFSKNVYKKVTEKILQHAAQIYVRDLTSYAELQQFSIPHYSLIKTFESVIGLNNLITEYKLPSLRDNIVGIAIYDAETRSEEEYLSYISTMVAFSNYLIKHQFTIYFFPHEVLGASHDDRPTIHKIASMLNKTDYKIIETNTIHDHFSQLCNCKCFIGHKTHSIVFALTIGTPLVAISYHQKTADFMKMYSKEEYCIPDDIFTLEVLIEKFLILIKNIDNVGLSEFNTSKLIAKDVNNSFANIFTQGLISK
jgi:colanic acid/amylovoran biosynthesis protein